MKNEALIQFLLLWLNRTIVIKPPFYFFPLPYLPLAIPHPIVLSLRRIGTPLATPLPIAIGTPLAKPY